jgi:hypothetical protein
LCEHAVPFIACVPISLSEPNLQRAYGLPVLKNKKKAATAPLDFLPRSMKRKKAKKTSTNENLWPL